MPLHVVVFSAQADRCPVGSELTTTEEVYLKLSSIHRSVSFHFCTFLAKASAQAEYKDVFYPPRSVSKLDFFFRVGHGAVLVNPHSCATASQWCIKFGVVSGARWVGWAAGKAI